jgi:hypothetical protein
MRMGKAASDRVAGHGGLLPEEETDRDAERERLEGGDKGKSDRENFW